MEGPANFLTPTQFCGGRNGDGLSAGRACGQRGKVGQGEGDGVDGQASQAPAGEGGSWQKGRRGAESDMGERRLKA